MRHHKNQLSADARLTVRLLFVLAFLLVAGWCHQSPAQWITQTNALRAGWNSVYLHVDPSHATLDQFVGSDLTNPIEEVWYWQPPLPAGQFVESPLLPTAGSQWSTWTNAPGSSNVLKRLTGNGAYLVKLAAGAAPYNWLVKGKPVTPTYRWTLTGLNFVGFSAEPGDADLQHAHTHSLG